MRNFFKHCASVFTCMLLSATTARADYYPLKIVNNAGNTDSSIHPYIILMAQDTTAAANFCVLQLTYNAASNAQVASLVPIQSNTNSDSFSYRIDLLQGYNPKTKSVTILMPNTISGRGMVSFNYKLYLPPVVSDSGGYVFLNPSVSNINDVNYDIIYDKFEFTYNTKNVMYIDPTAVDFFAIPIGLKGKCGTSGAITKAKRNALLKTISGMLNDSIDNKWEVLEIQDSGTILRITAPNLAPGFDASYLSQSSFNYIDSLIKYYQSNTLRINAAELDVAGDEVFDKYGVMPSQDSGAYIFTSQPIVNGLWIFSNNPATSSSKIIDTIDMNTVVSENFFGPGTTPFITPNKTVISIIVKNITAAFTVGLLPAPNGMMLDSNYLSNPSKYKYYKNNKQLKAPATTGPWYNLYTQALHKAIPQIYAFAYDDVLGQSGTLVSSDNTDTISLILGDMGNTAIPYHSGLLPVMADTLIYNSGFVHIGNQYIDTLKWKVPAGQPATAQYFFMGSGPDFTIPDSVFLSYQYGNFYSSGDTMGWVAIPDSLMSTCSNPMISMSVYSCGGPANPCPTGSSNWQNWMNAASYNILPAVDSIVYPVNITSYSGFTQLGNNYVATVSWESLPPGNPSNAQFFFMAGGPGFNTTQNTFVSYQVGSFYSDTTSGTITVPLSALNSASLDSVSLQMFTCGGPGHPCPTAANLSYWNCDIGSNIVYPTAATTLESRKRKKK